MQASISGSTGLIGSAVKRELVAKGWTIKDITRHALTLPDDEFRKSFIAGSDVIINLAGASIQKRWTAEYQQEILSSRIDTTRKIVQAIHLCEAKPSLLINASAVGIYDSTHEHTESSTNFNTGFLGTVCKAWESEAMAVESSTRVVIFRLGVVLDKKGGALNKMYPLFKVGLGGKLGDGKQPMPFIHIDDVTAAFQFAIENAEMGGVYNLVAPYPVNNAEFTEVLAKALKQSTFLPVPSFALKLMMGKSSEIVLKGQHVIPEKLKKAGFNWTYPTIRNALTAIYKR